MPALTRDASGFVPVAPLQFQVQPDFSIIEVVLGAFAHMDACPLLITSIVAVKPEDQGTFFQDFLGLSGYLCSIGGFYSNTALLRTRNAQNHNEAQRLAACPGVLCRGTRWWVGG